MAWFKFKLLTSYCLSFNCNLHPQFTSGHTSSLIKRLGPRGVCAICMFGYFACWPAFYESTQYREQTDSWQIAGHCPR